jgi:cell division protein FtsN
MAAEKFLEVGKFNKRVWADKTTDKLSQFGFPFSVVQKNNLWKKSYQVLVGPYGSDQEAETAHKTLAIHAAIFRKRFARIQNASDAEAGRY